MLNILTFVKRVGRKILPRRSRRPRKTPSVVKNVFGHILYQNPDDVAIDYSVFSGLPLKQFTEGELGCLLHCLRPGQTVLDIGANIGFYTLLFAQQVGPHGRVFSFEPGPRSFQTLKRNVTENGYTNVTLENRAVSNYTGTTQLHICPTGESDNRIGNLIAPSAGRPMMEIPTAKLDDYFANHTGPIDLIKMDIQGAEYMALQGMKDLLSRNPQVRIVIEYAPGGLNVSAAEFLALVRQMGFRIFDLERYPHVNEEVDDAHLLNKYADTGCTNLLLQR